MSTPGWGSCGGSEDGLVIGELQPRNLHALRDYVAHQPLLVGNAAGSVDHFQPELFHELIILVQNFALEQTETLERVGIPAEIHARLVELQLDAAGEKPVDRDVDRHAEVQGKVGPYGKAVELANPLAIDATRCVSGKCGIRVAVSEDDHPGFERRDDLVEQ